MTSILRYVAIAVLLATIAGTSYVGWTWLDGLVVEQVVVEGARHADVSAVLAVARVDSGGRLLDVDPAVIADRTRRHPWVSTAEVRRIPPGTVRIAIGERTPLVLALDGKGIPQGYLDRDGYFLPLTDRAVYDVPLFRGLTFPPNPTLPVNAEPVLDVLAALERIDPAVDALISSFELGADGEIVLHTAPAGVQTSIEVRLGSGGYAEKFERLQAFWMQAVLSRPEKFFETIDLRFDSQIVTKES